MSLLDFNGWVALNEQEDKSGQFKVGQTEIISKDPETKKIYAMFIKYIFETLGFSDDTTYEKMYHILKKYIHSTEFDDKFKGAIQWFNENGYPQSTGKPNPIIKKFQDAMNVGNFVTAKGEKSEFIDGIFGVATVKAGMRYLANQYEKVYKSNDPGFTVGDSKSSTKELDVAKKEKRYTEEARKIKEIVPDSAAVKVQRIGVGTQKIK